jgi:beta-1,4-mannosyl-glycoprotein beta-1,4-N-acetylglucosaminyltransferase
VYDYFNETIDILHIDGLHTFDAVLNDYNKWVTKTSNNAVILFHDVISYPNTVGKVFNNIQYPKFHFTHSAGLGVVCKNIEYLNKMLTNINIPNRSAIIYNNIKLTNEITIINQPKIIDCFIFYNELDMLTYRLNILNDVVDYFVIVEATHTFVGKEKPLFYQENKHLFEKNNHKIIHVIVDDFPHKYPNIDFEKKEQWNNEKFQRNCISRGIDKLNLSNNDIIIVSDVDEIPRIEILENIKCNKIIINEVKALQMDFYYYNLHSKLDHYTDVVRLLPYNLYKNINMTIDELRFKYHKHFINNAGWHLSYFGDEKFIKNKIENFAHQELNINLFTNQEKIQNRIKKTQDLFDRPTKIIHINIEDNDNLPPDYDIYLKNYYTNK